MEGIQGFVSRCWVSSHNCESNHYLPPETSDLYTSLHSPAHQVLLLRISAWPATGQQLPTLFPPPKPLLFLIFHLCYLGDLSKMRIWSLHFSVGKPSINFSSPAGYNLNSATQHTKTFQIWLSLVSSSPTQFPHLVVKYIFLFYSPYTCSCPILQSLKKPVAVLRLFHLIMPWNTPCPLPEISVLISPPNLLNFPPSFKSFTTSSVPHPLRAF